MIQMNTNTLNEQRVNTQQLRFTPISSNHLNSCTACNYGLPMQSYNNPQAMGTQMMSCGISPYQMITQPYTLSYQGTQMRSGNFNNMVHHHPITRSIMVQPTVDISETSSDIMISAYVSNAPLNDLNLNVSNDSLTISGTLSNGINHFVLNRTVPLSTSVRAEAVEATLQSGVLEIRLPKSEKLARTVHTCQNTGNMITNN
ncbi:Hsp20/alpha crystallin family protein [Clostridium kluyveri]|uniref:Hsp20/alpha crystallin family protein n=1 Tax=Clostridium kluyveri TaxID=1534 RepID=UPI0022485F3C|nr:Hsp20/alpha crystallin family protein [Clostridium kluyveri]UZQ50447.1 Hsp20/alpha crystallin family protein [Clostridium kluyveri]